jgi:hypothetical protein
MARSDAGLVFSVPARRLASAGERSTVLRAGGLVMGRIVIVAYRPKAGHSDALERLMLQHHERLRADGLVTDRAPILMRSGDGTIVEVFEWRSADAIASAHQHAGIRAMWDEYELVSDYVPLADLPEARLLFAEFEPVAEGRELHPEYSP